MQMRPRERLRWLPYVLPLLLFLVLTSTEQPFGVEVYPILYTLKIIVVGAVLFSFRQFYFDLAPNKNGVVLALALGPVLTALWIGVDIITPHFAILGSREAYNPFQQIHPAPLASLFVVIRVLSLITIAPIIEELFYRAFLLRWITNQQDFTKVPLGTYDIIAFIAVVLIMASSHPEYLAAALFSAIMNVLLNRTRNLWATIAAHGSTNFFLAVYILVFHAWRYW